MVCGRRVLGREVCRAIEAVSYILIGELVWLDAIEQASLRGGF